jgi:hypothetical protein
MERRSPAVPTQLRLRADSKWTAETFTGAVIQPFSGTFAGMLTNGSTTDSVTATISQSNYNLSVTGTANGTPFTLTGTAVGATFNVSGTIAGQSVQYIGLYETSTNDFRVYGTAFNLLGVLNAQSSAPPPTPISVSASPSSASVQVGQQANFTATVMNDNANKGVTWALSGTGCSGATCGSIAPTSSASGAAVVYTAPNAVPSGTVTLTATSVSDSTKSASSALTITAGPAITVSVSPTTASLATGGVTQSFTATVQNDAQNKGVTWSVAGANCSGAACGVVSPTSSASGAAVTYTSPPNTSSSGTVTLTATSVSSTAATAGATITLTAAAQPVNLGVGSAPSTVVDSNGVVDVAWESGTAIVFSQSTDQGATFSTPATVFTMPVAGGVSTIQVDAQNNIFILFEYNATGTLGANTAVLAHSADGGKTFINVVVKQNTFASQLLVQRSGVVHLIYTPSDDGGEDPDNSIRETHSTDEGNTFVDDQLLWSAGIASNDVLTLRGTLGPQGQIYLTWGEQSGNDCQVYFLGAMDGMNFASAAITLSNKDFCNLNPVLALDSSGNLNIAWEDGGLEFARSTDQGQTFSSPVAGPSVGTRGTQQLIAGPNGEIDLVFDAALTAHQVDFIQSPDYGQSWSTPINVSLPNPPQNFNGAEDPFLAVDSTGKITIAWADDAAGAAAGNSDIYIRTSTDGVNFSGPVNVSNTADQDEVNPVIIQTTGGMEYMTSYDASGQSNPVLSVFFYVVQ